MRKYLMVAALVAVAACGEKKAPAVDTTSTMAPPAAMSQDTTKKDTTMMNMKMDTTKKDTTKKP